MSVVADVERAVQVASTAFQAMRSTAEWYRILSPLRDAALLGDTTAAFKLDQYAQRDPDPARMAAARLLVGEIQARKQLGQSVAQFGVGLYPAQVSQPLIVAGILILVVLLLKKGRG